MSNGNHNKPDDRRASRRDSNNEFGDAVSRLEKAVQELVTAAKDETLEKATRFIDETSKTIETELRFSRVADEEASVQRERRRRRRRHRHSVRRSAYATPRSPRLYRDPTDEKIGGVCSGLAHYFGVETWVVRLGALTGLVFLPGVFFIGYWIAYFVMGTPPKDSSSASRSGVRRTRRRGRRRDRRNDDTHEETVEVIDDEDTQPAPPELESPFAPRRSLRNTGSDFAQMELRLRRMETFVTSGQYELHKELAKIDQEGKPNAQ